MSARHTPKQLPAHIRKQLTGELQQLTRTSRPKGRAGLDHDRRLTYLTTVLDGTTDGCGDLTATVGTLVTVRFRGDVEHRTMLLADGTTGRQHPQGPLHLPTSWELGQQLVGSKAGDTITYSGPDGVDRDVDVLAVWQTQDHTWQLPDTSVTTPAEG